MILSLHVYIKNTKNELINLDLKIFILTTIKIFVTIGIEKEMRIMRILSLDLSTHSTGWCIG